MLSAPISVGYADDQTMLDNLGNELSLSSEQRAFVDSVWEWRRKRSMELLSPIRPALDSLRDSARVLMINIFDSSQVAAFHLMLERNRRAADSVARVRGTHR